MPKTAYTYILANRPRGTLYTGVTSDLARRMVEHKTGTSGGFTAKYHVHILVWYISGESIISAIELEKKIKNRSRAWKIALIEGNNPRWDDLSWKFLNHDTIHHRQPDQTDAATARPGIYDSGCA